jgi:hypothetical protein
MKSFRTVATLFCLTLLCVLVVPAVRADDWNKKTQITFSAPFEVPGAGAQTLPAGTYTFKLLNNDSNRHIVQILNQEETHIYTTTIAIPNFRIQSTGDTVVTFRERPAGEPQALREWFYPGNQWGEEFVYAKSRAIVLAKESNEPVLATPVTYTDMPVEALTSAPVEAVGPKGEPVEVAAVVAPPEVAAATLPKTASPLPTIALLGLLSLCAGLVVSAFSKRTV